MAFLFGVINLLKGVEFYCQYNRVESKFKFLFNAAFSPSNCSKCFLLFVREMKVIVV